MDAFESSELPDEVVRVGEASGGAVCTAAVWIGVISMVSGRFLGAGFWARFWAGFWAGFWAHFWSETGWLYWLVCWTNLM